MQTVKLEGRLRLYSGDDVNTPPLYDIDLGGTMHPPDGQTWVLAHETFAIDDSMNHVTVSSYENARVVVLRNLGTGVVECLLPTRSYSWSNDPPPPYTTDSHIVRVYPQYPVVVTGIIDTTSNLYVTLLGAPRTTLEVTLLGTRTMVTNNVGLPLP